MDRLQRLERSLSLLSFKILDISLFSITTSIIAELLLLLSIFDKTEYEVKLPNQKTNCQDCVYT